MELCTNAGRGYVYVIAKNKREYEKQIHYAKGIQKLQYELGLPISDFPTIWVDAEDFFKDNVDKYDVRLR